MTRLEWLKSIASKYSNRNITITILDDQTYFECMDERAMYDERERQNIQKKMIEVNFPEYDDSLIDEVRNGHHVGYYDNNVSYPLVEYEVVPYCPVILNR